MPTLRSGGIGPSITSEGALLPADLLARISGGDSSLGGLRPADDYHLAGGTTFGEATTAAWNRVVKAWTATAELRSVEPVGSAESARLRERWLLPLFDALGYGRLPANRAAIEIEGRPYPVSHLWERFPVHLVSWNVELDRRTPGVAGAARQSPHSLMQELLNRSPNHLWGIVSNGRTLRLLRDSVSLTRQAFVEFDLQRMMDGELYADFVLLWLSCHPSRVEGPSPEEFWLERWMRAGIDEGTRALEGLRAGVEKAVQALGSGFLEQVGNRALRDSLSSGAFSVIGYYREVLRLVYQLIFLFTCEDRGVLLAPNATDAAQRRYATFYSTRHLRDVAGRLRGSPRHHDLWDGLRIVIDGLSRDEGVPALGLPAFGSLLFSAESTPHLRSTFLTNEQLLSAVRHLATVEDRGFLRSVDYRHLGAEELGGVYESLLELHPEVDAGAAQFRLISMSGNERRTTGSYYTPTSLTNCLLDSALDPLLERARRSPDPATSLLDLKVVDPACGSGHFLVAAAQRIAAALASVRSGEQEAGPAERRLALRDVVGRCIYGVDMNPMAAEICKIGLWLETVSPGLPLSFLDHHIRCGNALIGTTPALLSSGIPDDAYEPLTGDDKSVTRIVRKKNREERAGQLLLGEAPTHVAWSAVIEEASALRLASDATWVQLRAKAARYEQLHKVNSPWARERQLADAWCAAFVTPRTEETDSITEQTLRAIGSGHATGSVLGKVQSLADNYQFFHWHIEFPDVFRPLAAVPGVGWEGGFDLVVGNPPWERVKLSEQEFFELRDPSVASAANAAQRRARIKALQEDDPALYRDYQEALHRADALSHFIRNSGRYPLCGRGDVNTYSIFAELNRTLLAPRGRAGFIVPLGIATDDTTKLFFNDIVRRHSLVSLYGFENEGRVFPGIHHATKFCLLTITSGDHEGPSDFVFFARQAEDLADSSRHFALQSDDLKLLNPNTGTCPTFRSKRDATLNLEIYRRVPVLLNEADDLGNPWMIRFAAMFHMANDSGLFRTKTDLLADDWRLDGNVFVKEGARYLPLYEGKMLWHFDHRYGTYEGQTRAQANQGTLPQLSDAEHANPAALALPNYWVADTELPDWAHDGRQALLGFRNITTAVVLRSAIFTALPLTAVAHSAPLMLTDVDQPSHVAYLAAVFSSFVFDYLCRQKLAGSNLTFFIVKQLPVPDPGVFDEPCAWDRTRSFGDWVLPRAMELICTAVDMTPFARAVGYQEAPFLWDPVRRELIRAELDAAWFHIYGVSRENASYIMDTFSILRRADEKAHGEFRTKRLILEQLDSLSKGRRGNLSSTSAN